MLFYFCFILIAIIGIIVAAVSTAKSAKTKAAAQELNASSVLDDMSEEEKTVYDKIVTFVGHTNITETDIKAYQIHSIAETFASVPGGDFWDESVHNAPGQYDRLRRGVLDTPWLIAFDKKRGLANMLGSSDRYYLTSVRRCSCPDYRNRRLPCKHMYWLATALSGDMGPEVHGDPSHPFLGLTFAIAGRFAGNSKDEFVNWLRMCGAKAETALSRESTALICAAGRSEGKLSRAKELDMEIFSPDDVKSLFLE